MIFILEDDPIMAECIVRSCGLAKTKCFTNAIDAINSIDDAELPDLIFLDILLSGPDGFTFLNELSSYPDTIKIPIVIVSSLNFHNQNLSNYHVVGILNKETMEPKEITNYVTRFTH